MKTAITHTNTFTVEDVTDNPEMAALALAVARLVPAKVTKAAREALTTPTTQQVTGTLEVDGSLTVGEDTTMRKVQKLRPWAIALAALNRLNGDSIQAVVREAVDLDEKAYKAMREDVEAMAEGLLDSVTETRAGVCKFKEGAQA